MSKSQRLLLISIAILAVASGSMLSRWLSRADAGLDAPGQVAILNPDLSPTPAAQLIGSLRPDYTLGSSEGVRVSAADFDGSVVLVNFWATWCQPCREEMPMLADLHAEFRESGFEVVGIALDEVEQARLFAAELGITYPILVGSVDVMTVSNLYGNRSGALPYSVLLDREGIIRWAYLGELKADGLRQEINALLSSGSDSGLPN